MAYVTFNKKLNQSQIEALGTSPLGKVYFAKDGGIYLGEGTTPRKVADLTIEATDNEVLAILV